ncbi:MAG: uroporphyrinogen-III C-methyltransferase [Burkholderiaceae bacterium]
MSMSAQDPSSQPDSAPSGAVTEADPSPERQAPPPRTAAAPVRPPEKGSASWSWLPLAVAVVALVVSGSLWQRMGQVQEELARRSQDNAAEATQAKARAGDAEALVTELQARLSVAELRLSEVSLQRSQLEELMLSLSRSRDDHLVQDLESALRLAQQQTELTGSAQPLISALQAADQRIARAAQPRLNPVQRAIARDLDRIHATPLADVPSTVQALDELVRQVDDWPLVNRVGDAAVDGRTGPAAGEGDVRPAQNSEPDASGNATSDAGSPDGVLSGWARVSAFWRGWWTRVWSDVTHSGRELVRVSRIDRPEAALLAPEQAYFLRENLKLQMLNARLSLLARHTAPARSDLAATRQALELYFDTRVPQVASAVSSLNRLGDELVKHQVPRAPDTLAALAVAAEGR